jgi:hypothetical protein
VKTFILLFISLLVSTGLYAQQGQTNDRKIIEITQGEFDEKVDDSILNLETKTLKEISDKEHITIMMCLNTIFMRNFEGGQYLKLEEVAKQKKYVEEITIVYPENSPNRGMGYYFSKLRMELYGTPSQYAYYKIKKQ